LHVHTVPQKAINRLVVFVRGCGSGSRPRFSGGRSRD
jgi:hypothetical protein